MHSVTCNACYIGETSRHFSTRGHEHFPCIEAFAEFRVLSCLLLGRLFHSIILCGYKVPIKAKRLKLHQIGKARPESTGQTH